MRHANIWNSYETFPNYLLYQVKVQVTKGTICFSDSLTEMFIEIQPRF